MPRLVTPKKKSRGKKEPGLVRRGIAKPKYWWSGKLVRVKPKTRKEKEPTLKDLKSGAKKLKQEAANARRHGTVTEQLTRTNAQLATLEKRIKADRRLVRNTKIKVSEIVRQVRAARRNLPTAQANIRVQKLTVQNNALRGPARQAVARLAASGPKRQGLIKKLRALSGEKKALGKKLGLE
jgi:predicted  nucleic acid-binding Zn-ribbon protein